MNDKQYKDIINKLENLTIRINTLEDRENRRQRFMQIFIIIFIFMIIVYNLCFRQFEIDINKALLEIQNNRLPLYFK